MKFDALIIFGYLAFIGVIVTGWILNIVAVAHANLSDLTGMLILRIVGIFVAPLGVVLGYI